MTLRNQIPDKTLLKSVLQNMMRKGTNSRRVTATARSGDVTITGTIDYEHQRRSVVNSANNITGVKRIIDQLRVEKKKRT
jgi:osmotically-inducible protein OsmY